jgi:hypothetical protein
MPCSQATLRGVVMTVEFPPTGRSGRAGMYPANLPPKVINRWPIAASRRLRSVIAEAQWLPAPHPWHNAVLVIGSTEQAHRKATPPNHLHT